MGRQVTFRVDRDIEKRATHITLTLPDEIDESDYGGMMRKFFDRVRNEEIHDWEGVL